MIVWTVFFDAKKSVFVRDFTVQVPGILQKSTRPLNWNVKGVNQVYLTFDDGPTPNVTENVLNILDAYNVKGTFFCIGRNVERHPELFQELLDRGMAVGNHTYSHLNGWKTPNQIYFDDIEIADDLIHSNLFRPAYGKIRPAQMYKLARKYRIFMWDVLTKDYNQRISGEDCFQNIRKYARKGSIIVFHDSLKAQKNVEYALPKSIEFLLEQGFSLTDTLS